MKAAKRKCHSCGGYGTILFDGVLRGCKPCNGKGKVDFPKSIEQIVFTQEPIESPNQNLKP